MIEDQDGDFDGRKGGNKAEGGGEVDLNGVLAGEL